MSHYKLTIDVSGVTWLFNFEMLGSKHLAIAYAHNIMSTQRSFINHTAYLYSCIIEDNQLITQERIAQFDISIKVSTTLLEE